MDLQLLVLVFLCFALFLFLMNLQYLSPLQQDFLMKIFCSKLFALVLFSIIQDSSDSFKVEIDFIKKNENFSNL